MECTGYAEYERFDRGDASAVPPMTDAMQLIPRVDQTVAELMQSIFPDHMTSKVTSPSPFTVHRSSFAFTLALALALTLAPKPHRPRPPSL